MSTPSSRSGAPVALALGSNLGERLRYLRAAVRRLIDGGVALGTLSSVYESDPVGYLDQPPFLNAVLTGWTELPPGRLLELVRRVEAEGGRRRSFAGAPRTLDVDVIFYGDQEIARPELVIPHPRFRDRSFVLAPLAEVASDWVDPATGRTVLELWQAQRDDLPPARPVAPPDALLAH